MPVTILQPQPDDAMYRDQDAGTSFEPTSKRRRGFPLASPPSSAATESSALTPN
jgi:hypothetical protein